MITNKSLEKVISEFGPKQLDLIMDNVDSIELTEGCSGACPDCGLAALPGVRDYISPDTLENLFSKYSKSLKRQGLMLYAATDPFDYDFEGVNYVNIHDKFEKIVGISPCVVTNFPKGKEKLIWQYALGHNSLDNLIENGRDSSFLDKLSITKMNGKRVEKALYDLVPSLIPENQIVLNSNYSLQEVHGFDKIDKDGSTILNTDYKEKRWVLKNFDEIKKQLSDIEHDSFYLNSQNANSKLGEREFHHNLLNENNSLQAYYKKHGEFPSGKERDRIIRNSDKVEKEREELESKKPTFLSLGIDEVNRDGNGKLYVAKLPNGHFLAKESSSVSLGDLANYLSFRRSSSEEKDAHPPIIRDFREMSDGVHSSVYGEGNLDNLSDSGIGSFNGVIVSPSGFYNFETVKPSKKYPYGFKKEKITKENFKVVKYEGVRK